MSKSDYRLLAKNIRKSLNIKALSVVATNKIRNLKEYKSAEHVMIYYPLDGELDFRGLLKDNKKFYLPKVSENKLLACPYCDKFVKSELNIFEPCSEPVSQNVLDFIVVPALMADKDNYRLGYGGGFYDKFLPYCQNAYTVCVIEKSLFIDSLPTEDFDVKLNKVIVI